MNAVKDNICFSCGSKCIEDKPLELAGGPYALQNLLAVGVLIIIMETGLFSAVCNNKHADDAWHPFQAGDFMESLTPSDAELCRQIEYLIKHRFVSVTYLFGDPRTAFLRIYLIPYDLSNVQGSLRIRKEAILALARRYLKSMLPRITQHRDSWNGVAPVGAPKLFSDNTDHRSLAEIYGDLQSPQGRVAGGSASINRRLLNFEDNLSGFGLRSTLYRYQRVSVAAMLDKELILSDIPDPLFIPLTSMRQEMFYIQPGTMEVLKERPLTAACCSGVLCEELGTGKTVMILALILATINQISAPEESIVDDRAILTPLSFRYFPSSECVAARKRFFRCQEDEFPSKHSRIPTLVELLMHRNRTTPDTNIPDLTFRQTARKSRHQYDLGSRVDQIPPGQLLKTITPFYFHYYGGPNSSERTPRKVPDTGPRVVYLTSATLIVVPPNLISQWDREIQKHCEYPLRVLILRSGTSIPSPTSLASDYDIILVTYKRFTAENNYKDKAKLHSWSPCLCPEFQGSRIPNCSCRIQNVSPLLQVRWKRLVIDEGHVSASVSTILTPFTKLLSVERRWIVTGTPTTNLLGLSLGKKSSQETQSQGVGDSIDEEDLEHNNLSTSSTSSDSRACSPLGSDSAPRIWSKYDREDLNKLGKMITHFVAVPQFIADPKLVQTHIIGPLLDPQGPRPGAIQVLTQVMEMIMIRHRIEDVEKDVILPPVSQEAVLLDLDPYAAKSYNALQATIAINAIDSERKDQDYMFHPRNADSLQLSVKNMSQLMFWSTNDWLYNVDEITKNSQKYIDLAHTRCAPPEDMSLLREALKHVKFAAADPLWRAIQDHEDIPYRVCEISRPVFEAWSRTTHLEPMPPSDVVGFMHADRLLKIRDLIVQRPRISEENIVNLGITIAAKDYANRQAYKEGQNARRKSSRRTSHESDPNNTTLKTDSAKKKAKDQGTLAEMQKELSATMERLEREDVELEAPSETPPGAQFSGGELIFTSLLGKTRLCSSASSKVNYIINEVLQYAGTQKFLVFSDSELSLAHLSEALELIHIKFLRFTTLINPRQREQMVLTFETSEKYRVFLMELKHGARGLNLISASRVIFCEPVWQADVESQAIKRAHRIGQTKSITVKTLAIRGTAEEIMVSRRNVLKNRQEKIPKMIEEAGMRHFIANPTFIDYPPQKYSLVDVPLLQAQQQVLDACETVTIDTRKRDVRPEDPMLPDPPNSEPLPKKRKGVRFE